MLFFVIEIHIRVSGHHDNKDVGKFAQHFVQILRSLQVIPQKSNSRVTPPSLVFARLSPRGNDVSDRPLHEVMTYKDLSQIEEREKRKQKLMQDKNFAPMTSLAQIKSASNGGSVALPNSTAAQHHNSEPFDYDVTTWSKVFFSHLLTDQSAEVDWKENIMWASPTMTSSQSKRSDVRVNSDNMRFFEDLYFEPKFDETLNLTTSL